MSAPPSGFCTDHGVFIGVYCPHCIQWVIPPKLEADQVKRSGYYSTDVIDQAIREQKARLKVARWMIRCRLLLQERS